MASFEGKCSSLYLREELNQIECFLLESLMTPHKKSPSHLELGKF